MTQSATSMYLKKKIKCILESNRPKLRTNPNFEQTQTSNKPKLRTNLNFGQTQTSNKSKFRTNPKVSGLMGT